MDLLQHLVLLGALGLTVWGLVSPIAQVVAAGHLGPLTLTLSRVAGERGREVVEEPPRVPPGAIRLVNFDRHGDQLAVCAEEPGPPIRRGTRTIPRTRVWIAMGDTMRQVATEPGTCDPAWSPGGDAVAVAAPGGLWVLSRDLTTTTHLVNTSQDGRSNEFDYRAISKPAWSPDGTRIGVLVTNGGTSWVEVVDVKTGEQRFKSASETYSFRWESGSRSLRLGLSVVPIP
jgi:hypothetical protein